MAEEELQDAAAERRDRLRALRAAAELVGTAEDEEAQETPEENDRLDESIRFRNYAPRNKQFQENKVSPPSIPKFEDPVATDPIANGTEDPFVSIAPKQANWDLRRDVAKKLEKLERRTHRALIELLQEQEKAKLELAAAPADEGKD